MSSSIRIPVEVYSRISGYFRPVSQWNRGKQEEFRNRVTVDVRSLCTEMACSSSGSFNSAISTS